MQFSTELRTLLKDRGVYAIETCDHCGRILGPVRFTRAEVSNVWCSRQCRDGADAHAPGTCWTCGASLAGLRRGARFCSATCRKRENRKSQTAQISRNAELKTHGLQTRSEVLPAVAHPAFSGAPGTLLSHLVGGTE
jgi:hypothetical protein